MGYWLLQSDPARYKMLEAALARPETTWTARQYADKIAVGDKVVFWMSGPQGGAYAIGKVTARAQAIDEDPELDAFWTRTGESRKVEPRIRATQDRLLIAYPVLRDTAQSDPILKEMLVIRRPSGSVFPLTEEQFERIEQLASARPTEWSRDELILTLDLYLDTKAGRVDNRAEAERRLGRLFDRKPDAYEFGLRTSSTSTQVRVFQTPARMLRTFGRSSGSEPTR